FYLPLENNKWYDPARGYGQISDVVFRDITARTPFLHPSVVTGIQAEQTHFVYNINFQDVHMNGGCVADADDGNFTIDPATTDDIRIMKSARCR
ncbi:MAG TPA: hypothetical protein VFY84_01940, partial [Jiangellales bacterium]|nr:hypothetical protein [Jiangellales bacterium]